MTEAVAIRRLGEADLEDYRAIRLAALRTAPEAFGSVHAIEAAQPLAAHAERLAGSLVFGAYADGRIVGMAGLKRQDGPRDSHKGFVWGFYVEPGSRKRGIAGALIAALLQSARGTVEQLTLTVVRENAAAIALYERFGFSVYGIEPRALKSASGYSDEVLMVLRL